MRIAGTDGDVFVGVGPGDPRKDPPRQEPPAEDPPTEEPPHEDPPPEEPPRRDPQPEAPVEDPPKDPTLPEGPAEFRNRARLFEILGGAGTAMLVARAADGLLHHRPATIARADEEALYLGTALEAAQIVELTADPRIDVIVRGARGEHAAVVGTAEILRGGALVIVRPLWAEYWDGARGTRGVVVQLGARS